MKSEDLPHVLQCKRSTKNASKEEVQRAQSAQITIFLKIQGVCMCTVHEYVDCGLW